MFPPSIKKLIDLFSKFPTVGPRTAARFVFYLLKLSKEEIENLISSISELKNTIKICQFCFNPFQGEGELCEICSNPAREKTLLCIVEKETDLISIEKTKKYKGLYFILGGTINLKKDNKNIRTPAKAGNLDSLRYKYNLELRVEELKKGIKNNGFKEIIIATNSTPEGEATTLYIERELKLSNIKITRLGRGLPVGGELEYADEDTLTSALESRK